MSPIFSTFNVKVLQHLVVTKHKKQVTLTFKIFNHLFWYFYFHFLFYSKYFYFEPFTCFQQPATISINGVHKLGSSWLLFWKEKGYLLPQLWYVFKELIFPKLCWSNIEIFYQEPKWWKLYWFILFIIVFLGYLSIPFSIFSILS